MTRSVSYHKEKARKLREAWEKHGSDRVAISWLVGVFI